MSRVQTRPELAAIFFSMYVGMVFIVCINMFIGIITKYFEDSEVRVVLVSPCMPQCLCTRTQGPRFAAISITHEHAHA
jgi:hypothetical protein